MEKVAIRGRLTVPRLLVVVALLPLLGMTLLGVLRYRETSDSLTQARQLETSVELASALHRTEVVLQGSLALEQTVAAYSTIGIDIRVLLRTTANGFNLETDPVGLLRGELDAAIDDLIVAASNAAKNSEVNQIIERSRSFTDWRSGADSGEIRAEEIDRYYTSLRDLVSAEADRQLSAAAGATNNIDDAGLDRRQLEAIDAMGAALRARLDEARLSSFVFLEIASLEPKPGDRRDLMAAYAVFDQEIERFNSLASSEMRVAWANVSDTESNRLYRKLRSQIPSALGLDDGQAGSIDAVSLSQYGVSVALEQMEILDILANDSLNDAHEGQRAAARDLQRTTIWLVAVILATVFLTYLAARTITRPLGHLVTWASRLSSGQINDAPAISGPRDITAVAAGMQQLTQTLGNISEKARAIADNDFESGTRSRVAPGPIGDSLDRSLRNLRATNEKLRVQATTDILTGLANRGALIEALEDHLVNHQQAHLLVLDLNGFKGINDSFGHEAGDHLLTGIATQLDTYSSSTCMIARLGADEFAVGVFERYDVSELELLAGRIHNLATTPFDLGVAKILPHARVGVALYHPLSTASELLHKADLAVRDAKRTNRDVVVCTTELVERSERRSELQADLRRAIKAGELELFLQPVIELKTKRVVGAEALVRWRRDGVLVPPDDFIPVAEESSAIIELDRWVIRSGAHQAAMLRQEFGRDMEVAVNVSWRHVAEGNLSEAVDAALRDSRIDPHLLRLEMTESSHPPDSDKIIKSLNAVRGLGVGLSLDDFGTGFSSISQLRRFPFDVVKLDRSLVQSVFEPDDGLIVDNIISMSQALGIEVHAEGIETNDFHDHFVTTECRFAQGWLYGRPVPVAEFVAQYSPTHAEQPEPIITIED